jgi:nuclear pore complex protein Nup155
MEMCETRGLPKAIQDEVRKVQCCNYYGLFPEIHRAYITVDNHLYLWDYDHGTR